MTCGHCRAAGDDVFIDPLVRRELKRYRKRGPRRTTRLLLDALRERGVEGARILDIGGGVGVLGHELLDAGAADVLNVEAAPAYRTACAEEAERRGHGDRLAQLAGDFVDLAPDIEPAHVVTLDRVVCCYPHMRVLVGASATRALRLYGLVFPREHLLMRVGVGVLNLVQRLRGSAFRVFVHPGREVDDELDRRGFRKVWSGSSLLWQVRLYERVASASA